MIALMANYIDNKRFEELIQIYSTGDMSVQEELFDLFGLLIDRLMTGYSFKVDKDEAKQECFLLILRVLKNFNRESGAAFNYFTTVILNNLRLVYTKNKKYQAKLQEFTDFKLGINTYSPSSADMDPV
jgi:DNA-directed RNA polymerase specialized sigma24 family protein